MVKTLLLGVVAATWVTGMVSKGPRLIVGPDQVTVSDLTVGGRVAWVYAMREIKDLVRTLEQTAIVDTDYDEDGAISLSFPDGVITNSVFVGVDLETGQFASATPTGSMAEGQPLPPGTIVRTSADHYDQLRLWSRQSRIVVMRQFVGAWTMHAADGGLMDLDGGCDGVTIVSVDDFLPLTTRIIPIETIQVDDVVVLIDLETLEYTTVKISAGDFPPSLIPTDPK